MGWELSRGAGPILSDSAYAAALRKGDDALRDYLPSTSRLTAEGLAPVLPALGCRAIVLLDGLDEVLDARSA